ncbi:MAG: peptidase T [Clostridia bacterium]
MSNVVERFLRYVSFDTRSADGVDKMPSTDTQFELGRALVAEMQAIGLSDVRIDEHCYVYGFIPANTANAPALGFIAHMDTATDAPGRGVLPRIVEKYDGGVIPLNDNISILPGRFPELSRYVGQDIIVTDGTTLLGADDKAGVAEILTMAEYLLANPQIKHGRVCIGFTPDEEVGNGANMFDIAGFGADFAYTVDGGELGELEYENFNGASVTVHILGRTIHPGSAKDVMLNAIHIAEEFDSLLPAAQRPEHTSGYDGFFHITQLMGNVDKAAIGYIVRDHDMDKFNAKKELMRHAASFINAKYGNVLTLSIRDSYFNMKDALAPHMHLIDTASEAMRDVGVNPSIVPIRGGTDGARLTFMGLPCPNLCTGGHNFHGVTEYIPIQSMEKVVEILVRIVVLTCAKQR